MRVLVCVLWFVGAATDMTLNAAYTAEPAQSVAGVNFDELHSQANAAIERLELAQQGRMASL